MTVDYRTEDGVCVVTLHGNLAITTIVDMKKAIEPVLRSSLRALVLQCAAVQYIDSTGMGFLQGLYKRLAQQSAQLILVHLNQVNVSFLESTGMAEVVRVFATVEEALAFLNKS